MPIGPLFWIAGMILLQRPHYPNKTALELADNARVVCDATVGELAPRAYYHCIELTVPGVIASICGLRSTNNDHHGRPR